MSKVYSQLARMPTAFSTKVSNVVVPALTLQQILAENSLRVYVAFDFLSANTDSLIPENQDNNNFGFRYSGANQVREEFWIEKHKSLVVGSWSYNRPAAGTVSINIVEIFYRGDNE